MNNKIRQVFDLVGGFSVYMYLVLTKGLYSGGRAFYRASQTPGDPLHGIAQRFLDSKLREPFDDYSFYKANKDKERLTTAAIAQYSDDSLLGYGDVVFDKGGASIPQQQRGLILPLLRKALEGKQGQAVVEIGSGNGDVLAYLQKEFPNHGYLGVDLSVKNAVATHKGITFVKGYALDLLAGNSLKGNILFASSTFVIFAPKELKEYLWLIKAAGFSEIILSEPSFGYKKEELSAPGYSHHLSGPMWYHNFCGYLREAGFSVVDYDVQHYKHPRSDRPDLMVSLIRATANSVGSAHRSLDEASPMRA